MKRSSLLAALTATVIPFSATYADALLFPYVVTSNTVASIVSVVNKSTNNDELFLNYFTKNSLSNTASCTNQLRTNIDAADNDLVSFDVNGSFTGGVASAIGGPLFNDPAGDADYGGDNFTLGPVSGATRAFLIVDDNQNAPVENLYGEVMVLETLGGAAWGYRAYNPADDFGQTNPNFPEFDVFSSDPAVTSPTNDNLGEVLDDQNNTDTAPVTLLPTDEWETRFFVTPISSGDQRCEDCNAAIKLTRSTSESALGIYDRDSNPLTGSNTIEVICVSGVSLQELLPTNLQATVAAQGGWGYVNVDPGAAGGTQAPGAVVMKLEFNSAQFISPDASNSFVGTVNTAVWLRNRDNTEGVSGF